MIKFFSGFLLAITGFAAYSQNAASTYARMVNADKLQQHLSVIAGAEMEGRETGTEGQRKAAAYIENVFKTTGLSSPATLKGYQQYYPLHQDSLTEVDFKMNDTKWEYGKDFIIPTSNAEGEFKGKRLVFAGYGISTDNYNDYANLDVKDKVVIMFTGEPKNNQVFLVSGTERSSEWTYPGISKKLALAASKGAAGVLMVSPITATFSQRAVESSRKTNFYYPRPTEEKILLYAMLSHDAARNVLGANADTIIAMARTSRPFNASLLFDKDLKTKLEYKKKTNIVNASNVLGVVEGSDKKDEYVFVTGHYDHLGIRNGNIYYGADDDGSGTCAVITMAEAFAKAKANGHGPRRTMVFMTVSGEEKGLWGSEYYSDHPVYPLEKTTADLNIDMIGRVDTERMMDDTLNYVYVVGHDKLSTELPLINEAINKQTTNMVLDYKFDDPTDKERIYFRSDHYNFARKGVPVLFFYDGMLKADYHKPTDTIDKINFALYEKRAKMIFYTAWEMANRDNMLVRDLPLPTMTR
ncbi:MAG: M28 family peptidase [Ferruginibacter sp.]